ncbi:ester cyclase [Actinokineospora iranica]|uniref:Ketosteroid isomerase-related protein n=1 Tax=Actinokineospora iranica TaxID=1271860 RepID=A0A1G6TYQ5_9PSEU|nr:ester cyclase [Actinokineospora iranica]SDD34191.1 Ketosteroid isomerase-related protein [Actinokineospora iranica]
MLSAAEVHRRIVEMHPQALATGELAPALALVDPDVIDHRGGSDGDHHGIDAWRRKWETAMAADNSFHDTSVTIEQNVTAGDISVNRYTSRGTHTATGKHYAVHSMDMIRVRDGKIVEHWALQDTDAIRHQLGLDS